MDRFTLEIIQDALTSVGQDMFETVERSSMSPIIYEALDYAVCITNAKAEMVAQGNGVITFLAALSMSVQCTLDKFGGHEGLNDGDVIMANTPYIGGGTHLSDVAFIRPVFYKSQLVAFTVNKAHWTDIGGTNPGSVSTESTEIFQEGMHFPYIKIRDKGIINSAVVEMIEANVRLPQSALGDMNAGIAAADVGADRIIKIIDKYGLESYETAVTKMIDYGERMCIAQLKKLPNGIYKGKSWIENDGFGKGPFPLKLAVEIEDDFITFDFTGSHSQLKGPFNLSMTGLETAVRAVFKAVTSSSYPANHGSFKRMKLVCPEGTVVSAVSPSAMSVYYEVFLASIDLLCKTLAPVAPQFLPAGHFRSVCATYISGIHPDTGEFYVQAEHLAGGWGASLDSDGNKGQFSYSHGDSYNIPVEIRERKAGLLVEQHAFHNEGGGYGEFQGGNGIYTDFLILSDEALITGAFFGYSQPTWGVNGGSDGSFNYFKVIRKNGDEEKYGIVTNVQLEKGDRVRLVTATGGGYGRPMDRMESKVLQDVKNGYITTDQAEEYYGIHFKSN